MAGAYQRHTPAWHDYPTVDTPIDATDLEGWEAGLLDTNNALIVLTWNGSTYVPQNSDTGWQSSTAKRRLFIGPTDPSTVGTITLSVNDMWVSY